MDGIVVRQLRTNHFVDRLYTSSFMCTINVKNFLTNRFHQTKVGTSVSEIISLISVKF